MSSQYKQQDLEHIFAEDFSSSLFPILAEIYFKQRQYNKAQTICRVGLQSNPHNYIGQYILSKIMLVDGKIIQAEKILKKIVKHDPLNMNALFTLIEVLATLKRNSNIVNKYIIKAHKILPQHKKVIKLYNNIAINQSNQKKKKLTKESVIKNKKRKINKQLATRTMYRLMKQQKQYNVAKEILNILKKEKKHKQFVKQEITHIKPFIEKEIK